MLSHASLVSSSTEKQNKEIWNVGIASLHYDAIKNKIHDHSSMLCLVNQIHKAINYVVPDITQGCGLRTKTRSPRFLTMGKSQMPLALEHFQNTALYTHMYGLHNLHPSFGVDLEEKRSLLTKRER